jgi:opacity protein-like surface antigen
MVRNQTQQNSSIRVQFGKAGCAPRLHLTPGDPMLTKRIPAAFFLLAVIFAFLPGYASAQTSVSASVYGAFSGTVTSDGVQQSPANQAGGLVELRHISNPIFGFEGTYSFNRANQTYNCSGIGCPVVPVCSSCPPITRVSVPANAHEITADWTPSLHIANFRPFGVLGAGALISVPSGDTTNTNTKITGVYVYGAGLDWGLLPHIGLRLQYRGNLYKAPDLTTLYTSTNAFAHTAEPMVGLYFNL